MHENSQNTVAKPNVPCYSPPRSVVERTGFFVHFVAAWEPLNRGRQNSNVIK